MKKYYALTVANNEAHINIYGDITSWRWLESDVSSYTLSKELEGLDVDVINVYINSYGGEVAEGLAIYNALKRHKAKIKTYCDGFAASIASVIFMAGEERIMSNASLLFIHNAWTYAGGNAKELRKQADDLEVITQTSINAYMECVKIEESELKSMLDGETWISPQDAVEKGFATSIESYEATNNPSQSVRGLVVGKITKNHSPAVQLKVGEEVIERAMNKAIEKVIATMNENAEKNLEKPEQPTNKPLNMMRALLNLREEE